MSNNPAKRIRLSADRSTPSADLSATTRVWTDADSFTFLWSLENFSKLNGSEPIKSPVFVGGPKTKNSWQLQATPRHKVYDKASCVYVDYFQLKLSLVNFGEFATKGSISAGFRISILGADGQPAHTANGKGFNVFDKGYNVSKSTHKFITNKELISPASKLVQNDCLKIKCEIWYHPEPIQIVVESASNQDDKQRKETLSKDLGNMFQESKLTDLTIKTDNGTFRVHKAMLASRSPVFDVMFTENRNLENIEISGFDDEVLQCFLQFIYTGEGETDLFAVRAPELLQIAGKYDLAELKKASELKIAERITVDNAMMVLSLARSETSDFLKTRAIQYIKSNLDEVKKTDAYEEFKKSATCIFLDIVD